MIVEIWQSFRRLPMWVQLWIAVILVPVNAAAIFFVAEPLGVWVAALAIGGMLPNLAVMAIERGFSKTMALPHIVIWTPLIVVTLALLEDQALISDRYQSFLVLLLAVDVISLCFDYIDGWKWWKGDREIA